jgi:hypothetical protein
MNDHTAQQSYSRTAQSPVTTGRQGPEGLGSGLDQHQKAMTAAATIFGGRTTVPVSDAYVVILPDMSKMTPFAHEAIMSAMIESRARKLP